MPASRRFPCRRRTTTRARRQGAIASRRPEQVRSAPAVPGLRAIPTKWRRIKLGTEPSDTLGNVEIHRSASLAAKSGSSAEMDAASIITSPAFPERLSAGWWPFAGSPERSRSDHARQQDGGRPWQEAALSTPATQGTGPPRAAGRVSRVFMIAPWTKPATFNRPTSELRGVPDRHRLPLQLDPRWRVARDGSVSFEVNT